MLTTIDFDDFIIAFETAQEAIKNLQNEAEILKSDLQYALEIIDSIIDACETIQFEEV